MSIGGKIRFLLLVLGLCCIVTAISLKHSITKKDLLEHKASVLQKNLTLAEQSVNDFLTDPGLLKKIKSLDINEDDAFDYIANFRGKGINVLTFNNNELTFWSSYKTVISNPESRREGISFELIIAEENLNFVIIFYSK